jgi:hypothetical protein
MSRLPLLLVEPELRIQEFLLERQTRAGAGVEVGVYNGWVLASELTDFFPEECIKIEVVGQLVEEGRAVEGFIVHLL